MYVQSIIFETQRRKHSPILCIIKSNFLENSRSRDNLYAMVNQLSEHNVMLLYEVNKQMETH